MDEPLSPQSPLLLSGWHAFNQAVWGIKPLELDFNPSGSDLPHLRSVLYLTRRGRIAFPPRNPYLPISYQPTPSQHVFQQIRQWLLVAGLLAREMRRRGVRNTLSLPPQVTDVRPWQRLGFRAAVRYTLYLDFPYDIGQAESEVRRQVKKASIAGYRCERTDRMADILACLHETEARQGFQHHFSTQQLELAHQLMGSDHFRTYVCYAPNGEPASATIVLASPGTRAFHWVLGTRSAHLAAGATHSLVYFLFQDLQTDGSIGIDFLGANLPSVSKFKESWGPRLVPFYYLEDYSPRQLGKWVRDWWVFRHRTGERG